MASSEDYDVLVIGGGLAGLSAGLRCHEGGLRVLVLEAGATPGGLARSFRQDGFTFDCSGHLLHLKRPETISLVERITEDDEWARLERRSVVAMQDTLVPYPFQANLAYAPPEVREACLATLPKTAADHAPDSDALTLKDWVQENLGDGIGRYFMYPYNEKLTTVPTEELIATALGRFLPTPSLTDIREGALRRREENVGYNATFRYPRNGGIDLLWKRLAARLGEENIRCSAPVVAVDTEQRQVEVEDGTQYRWQDRLISSAPLPEMCAMVGGDIGPLAKRMRASSVICVNLGVTHIASRFHGLQWVYLPEPEYSAYRIGFYSGLVPEAAPPGEAAMYVEIAYQGETDEDAMVKAAVADCLRLGVIESADDIRTTLPVRIPYGYVTHDRDHRDATTSALNGLRERGIEMVGRYGRWEYAAMEDALSQGHAAAQEVLTRAGTD